MFVVCVCLFVYIYIYVYVYSVWLTPLSEVFRCTVLVQKMDHTHGKDFFSIAVTHTGPPAFHGLLLKEGDQLLWGLMEEI